MHLRPCITCTQCGGHILQHLIVLLQRLPAIGCVSTMLIMSFILYALASPQGVKINTLSPQGVVIAICAAGTLTCLYTCLTAPATIRKLGYAIRPEVQIRRMNLLGLVG